VDKVGNSEAIKTKATENLAAFGAEVRALRKARQMTLSELAESSGVSLSHLSAIERGTVSASLGKVASIAEALGVPEEWFFTHRPGAGPLERRYVVREQNRRSLNQLYHETVERAGYSDALLSSSIGGGFYMGISEYPAHSEQVVNHIYARDGEMHGFVIEGEMELLLEDETITVRAGDSFSFPGQVPHSARNASDKPARLIWVNSPVIIPKLSELEPADQLQIANKIKPSESGEK